MLFISRIDLSADHQLVNILLAISLFSNYMFYRQTVVNGVVNGAAGLNSPPGSPKI